MHDSSFDTPSSSLERAHKLLSAQWLVAESNIVLDKDSLVFDIPSTEDMFDDPAEIGCYAASKGHTVMTSTAGGILLVITGSVLEVDKFTRFTLGDGKKRGSMESGNARMVWEHVSRSSGKDIGIWAGLTIHDGCGSWSSWPAHEFETEALMAPVELFPAFSEIFAFVTKPMGKWGILAYADAQHARRSGTMTVRDGDIIHVPLGAHPVVAGPDTRMAYFWAYTGGWPKFH